MKELQTSEMPHMPVLLAYRVGLDNNKYVYCYGAMLNKLLQIKTTSFRSLRSLIIYQFLCEIYRFTDSPNL